MEIYNVILALSVNKQNLDGLQFVLKTIDNTTSG